MYRHDEPNEPTKEGHLSYVLPESPSASVSTVSRGHLSLVFSGKVHAPQLLGKGKHIVLRNKACNLQLLVLLVAAGGVLRC